MPDIGTNPFGQLTITATRSVAVDRGGRTGIDDRAPPRERLAAPRRRITLGLRPGRDHATSPSTPDLDGDLVDRRSTGTFTGRGTTSTLVGFHAEVQAVRNR